MDSMIVTLPRKRYATTHLARTFVIVVMVTAEKMESTVKVIMKFYKTSCSDVVSCYQQWVMTLKEPLSILHNKFMDLFALLRIILVRGSPLH